MISGGASNRELVKAFVKLTPEKVIGGNFPSMAKLKKEAGEKKLSEALAILLIDASLSFGDPMNKEQALDLSTEILTYYYYLSLEECMLVLNRLKRTKVFKFTINVVLTAFDNYDHERLKIIDDNNYSNHLSIKETRTAGKSTQSIINLIKASHQK